MLMKYSCDRRLSTHPLYHTIGFVSYSGSIMNFRIGLCWRSSSGPGPPGVTSDGDGGAMVALAAALALVAASSQPRAVRVAERQLFFDSTDLAQVANASHRLHRPVIHGPPEPFALVPEMPWEGGRFNYYHSVVDNGTHVLMYYDSLTADGPIKDEIQRVTCLAVSADGVTFQRPNLRLVTFNGIYNPDLLVDLC